jgi:hypothetical protein
LQLPAATESLFRKQPRESSGGQEKEDRVKVRMASGAVRNLPYSQAEALVANQQAEYVSDLSPIQQRMVQGMKGGSEESSEQTMPAPSPKPTPPPGAPLKRILKR